MNNITLKSTNDDGQENYGSPLISIIIPCFNCSTFIIEAISSVIDQNYTSIEIIIIDDGSVDGSAEIADQYGSPVKVIRQKNQGPAAARNRGIRESKGEFIAFLDGDDVWLPNKLADQVRFLQENQDVDIIYGDFKRWPANNNGKYPPPGQFISNNEDSSFDPDLSGWIYHKLLLDSSICIITALIRRTLYDKLGGFDEGLRTGEDYDFWLRASRITQAHKLRRAVALYRTNPSSTTHIPRPMNNEHYVLDRIIKKYGLLGPNGATVTDEEMKQRLYRLTFAHGYMHFWNGSACIARKNFKEARQYTVPSVKLLAYNILAWLKCLVTRDDTMST